MKEFVKEDGRRQLIVPTLNYFGKNKLGKSRKIMTIVKSSSSITAFNGPLLDIGLFLFFMV